MTTSPYGPYMQNAYVVADLDAAIDHWVGTMKVGPFYKFPALEFPNGTYRGKTATIRFLAAIAYSGDLQIELIQPVGPSIFQEALESGHRHVHHLCAMSDDMDSALADFTARGAILVQHFTLEDGSRCAYLDMGRDDGLIVEIAYMKAAVTSLFAALKETCASWDRATPLVAF